MTDEAEQTEALNGVGARIDQWRRRAGRVNAEAVARILEDADSQAVLYSIFENTKYLADCCLAHPDAVIEALRGEPARVLSEVARDLRALDRATGPATALARAVRPCKERGVVAIALAEISGKWPIGRAGAALADLGERTLDAALSWLTRMAVRHGDIMLKDDAAASPLAGLFVLGGGDFSAGEASYCGPLEAAVLYDPAAMEKAGVTANERTLVRLAETLKDTFRASRETPAIFELDLDRLTKRPGETAAPSALTVTQVAERLADAGAARERAWFAHARVVAGDRATGTQFLERATARVWQAGLTAEEIRSAVMSSEPGEAVDPIWRLAQTCRLALGARLDEVRLGSAHAIFQGAAKIGALDNLTATRLGADADFWQAARNRLQLITGRARMSDIDAKTRSDHAVLCGYSRLELFDQVMAGCVAEAEQQWLNIVEPTPRMAVVSREMGVPSTSVRLEELGFTHGAQVASVVDKWIQGRYGVGDPATGRRRLSEVAPGLLTDFANTEQPDRAITLFDEMLTHVPQDFDPFKHLNANPMVASALVDLLGNTGAFGDSLASSPSLIKEIFDGSIEPPEDSREWLERYPPPRPRAKLDPELMRTLTAWTRENRARLVFYLLTRLVDAGQAGRFLATIAEQVVSILYKTVAGGMGKPGSEPGRGMAVVALGDFGGRELVPGAALDLAFVYDPATEQGPNDAAHAYYQRFAGELAAALTGRAPEGAADGPLFDIDTRKRPGGAGGDIATDINVYLNFYLNESHPEEHVELTRARIIAGPQGLKDRLEAAMGECVTRPRKVERLMIDADKGRSKQLRRNKPGSIWDIERIKGGFGDLCFVAELLQVRHGAEHPYVLSPGTGDALAALARAGCLDPDTATDLAETHQFFSRLRMMLTLTGATSIGRERPRQRMQALIARAAGVASYNSVEPLIQGHAERVQAHYKRLILGDESASAVEGIIAA